MRYAIAASWVFDGAGSKPEIDAAVVVSDGRVEAIASLDRLEAEHPGAEIA